MSKKIPNKLSDYNISGIYVISFINDLFYIGQAKNIGKRWEEHLRDLFYVRHRNIHIQRIYNKYGVNGLSFTVLEECPIEQLNNLEEYWADMFYPNLLVNQMGVGEAIAMSEETKNKIRVKKKGTFGIVANVGKRSIDANKANDIRRDFLAGAGLTELAKKMKLDTGSIGALIKGGTYILGEGIDKSLIESAKEHHKNNYTPKTKHTAETKQKLREQHIGKTNESCRKFTPEQVNNIRRRFIKGATVYSIAKANNVRPLTVNRILKGKFYFDGDGVDKALYTECAKLLEHKPNY